MTTGTPPPPHPVLGVLRAGVLLGLGWVAAAGLAWEAFGVPWAALILVAWLLLLRRFHGAVQALAVAIRAEIAARR
ncbi:hypothetical protein [Roseomonas sp. CECT 9278]|uniref:hypothetical protein n=1 Tax=Roseomonas sp. CECT 9278 TaxID=2845823 RepID=UPI001E3BF9B9|nr:hypothetical protein [Roseomonas sp. CECT 9278]CAH0232035.1 hypothetical protein ROS9278_02676 [Roseomonas sp. CECT 9278]